MADHSNSQEKTGGLQLNRDLGVIGLLFIAVGSTLGSSWLFGALYAAQSAGPASLISWAIGAVMVFFLALVYAELGTMFPLSGGIVRFPQFAFGSFASYMHGWTFWIAVVSTAALEVLAALQYANSYFPWLEKLTQSGQPTITLAGFGVGVGLLALFGIVNIFGIHWLRRVNNTLVWWKLGIIILVIIAFVVTVFHGGHFTYEAAGGFFPYGWEGVFTAVSTSGVAFAYLGFREGIDLAGESKNPKRYVPIALIGTIIIAFLLYIGLEVAFIGAIPTSALANGWANIGSSFSGALSEIAATFGPLAAVAGFLGLTWLATLLYIDAFISPSDTSLILTAVSSRVSYAMGRNRNAPQSLSKLNKHRVPWISIIVTFIVGVLFLYFFPGWGKLVGFVTSATILTFSSGPLILLCLRKELPDRERPFTLKWPYAVSYLAFLSGSLIFYWSGWVKIWKLMIVILIGFVLYAIHEFVNRDQTPDLELRSGFWVLVWLGGLTIISFLGSFPDVSKNAGNLGLIPIEWGILVLAVFDAFVMWLAVKFRMPTEKVKKYLEDAKEEIENE